MLVTSVEMFSRAERARACEQDDSETVALPAGKLLRLVPRSGGGHDGLLCSRI